MRTFFGRLSYISWGVEFALEGSGLALVLALIKLQPWL